MIPRFGIGVVATAILASLAATPARAAESYDSCTGYIDALPAVISTQGNWCLRANLATAMTSGYAITVAANNVTIDCNGFKIGGLAGGIASTAYGIRGNAVMNATVRDCHTRGFSQAISFSGGAGHVVEHNRVEGATRAGIGLHGGDDLVVRGNHVSETGGGPTYSVTIGIWIDESAACGVVDNIVVGVSGATSQDWAGSNPRGIAMNCSGGEVRGNRVGSLVVADGGRGIGIRTDGEGARVVDNFVQVPVLTIGTGLSGEGAYTVCERNTVIGFDVPLEYCLDDDNILIPAFL